MEIWEPNIVSKKQGSVFVEVFNLELMYSPYLQSKHHGAEVDGFILVVILNKYVATVVKTYICHTHVLNVATTV